MKLRLVLFCAILLACTGTCKGQAQNFPGSGGGITVGNTFIYGSAYGGVDDDSTDNCANGSIAAFTTAVNAYSGPGRPIAVIAPTSGSSKQTYKLATNANSCTFAFTNIKGAIVHLYATLDCAQTAQSCIQFGPSGQGSEVNGENYSLDGGGMLIGGANLTLAGVYAEPGLNQINVDHIQWGQKNAAGFGFGASTTLGNCTNYALYIDFPTAAGNIVYNTVNVASPGTASGGCGFANPGGASTGSNTIVWEHNIIGTGGTLGGVGQCGSQGIIDGGSYGTLANNNIFGFGVPIRVQGVAHKITGNQIDSAGTVCAPAGGVSAHIHIGAASSSTAVGPITILNNTVQIGGDHATYLFAIAGNSTATAFGLNVEHNQNSTAPGSASADSLITPATFNCTPNPTAQSGGVCMVGLNPGFRTPNSLVGGQTGFYNPYGVVSALVPATQTANLGSTLLYTPNGNKDYIVWCEVAETVAGSVSSTLPSCVVTWTHGFTGATASQTITATSTANTVGTTASASVVCNSATGNAINISTTGYASNAAGMTYQLKAFVMATQ